MSGSYESVYERREQSQPPAVETAGATMSSYQESNSHRRYESSSRIGEGVTSRSYEYTSAVARPAVTTVYEKTSANRGYVAGSGLSSYGAHCTVALRSAREKEKGELIYLNDQLADYIEKVRFLEAQNRILSADLELFRRGFTAVGIESMCHSELETAKRVITDTHAARKTFESDIGRLGGEVDTWRAKWLEVLKTRKGIRGDLDADLDKLAGIEAEIALVKRRIRIVEEECIGVRQHNTRIGADISRVKSQRDHELIVAREHQARVQEFLVRVQHFAEEQRYSISREIEFIRRDTTAENRDYFRRELQAAMRDIRANYESIVYRNRVEIEGWYHSQVRRIEGGIGHVGRGHEAYRVEITRIRTELTTMRSRMAELESRNIHLQSTIQDLTFQSTLDHQMFEASLAERDRATQHMRDQCTELTIQMESLCDVQITLEKEITRYRSLIQGASVRTYDAYSTSSRTQYVAPVTTTSYRAYESSSTAHRSGGGGYSAYSATASGGGGLAGGQYVSTLSGGGAAIGSGVASGGSVLRETTHHESSSYRASSAAGSIGSETKKPDRIHDENEVTEDGRKFHRWYKGTVRITSVTDSYIELENICIIRRVDASGLQMRQQVGGELKTTFTLPDGLILDPKQTVKIYSANSNYPEGAFVANIDYFSIEEDARTSIYNREEEERAWFVYTS